MGEVSQYMTSADWANMSRLLLPFWILVLAVFGFAGSMLLAQGVLPSLAATRDLPDPRLVKLRPALYLGAVGFLALAVVAASMIVARAGILGDIFHFRLV